MKNLGIEFDISSDITIRYFITSKDQIIHLEEKSFSKPDEFLFKENSFILSRIDEDNYLPNKCDNKHSKKISGKFKNKIKENPFQNKIIYEQIIQHNNKELNSIFSQSLISFFKNVYCKKEKYFVINGKTITLSDRVKNYEDLLDSCDNDRYREKIKEEVQNTYFKKPFQVNIQNEES